MLIIFWDSSPWHGYINIRGGDYNGKIQSTTKQNFAGTNIQQVRQQNAQSQSCWCQVNSELNLRAKQMLQK